MPTVGRLKDGEFLISGEYNERLPTITQGLICHFPMDGNGGTFDLVGGFQPIQHTTGNLNLAEAMNLNWRNPSSWRKKIVGDTGVVSWDESKQAIKFTGQFHGYLLIPIIIDYTKHYQVKVTYMQESQSATNSLYLGGFSALANGASFNGESWDYSLGSGLKPTLNQWKTATLTRFGTGNYPTGWTGSQGLAVKYYFGGLFNYDCRNTTDVVYIKDISIIVTDADNSNCTFTNDGIAVEEATTNVVANPLTWSGWRNTGNSVLTDEYFSDGNSSGKIFRMPTSKATSSTVLYSPTYAVSTGQTITFSFWARKTGGSGNKILIDPDAYNASYAQVTVTPADALITVIDDGQWHRYSYSFVISGANAINSLVFFYHNTATYWNIDFDVALPQNDMFYTGLVPRVVQILKEQNLSYQITDMRVKPTNTDANFKIQKPFVLRDYQQTIVDNASTREIIQAATGAGKTFIMANLIAKYNVKPVLVIAPKVSLASQIKDEFEKFLGIKICLLGGGHNITFGDIIVSTPQSCPPEVIDEANMILFDECLKYDQKVLMADGTYKEIGKLVEEKSTEEVMSYNHTTKKLEPKPIISHSKTPLKKNNKKMMRIKVRKADGTIETIECTDNHKIWVESLGQYVMAKDLVKGQSVKTIKKGEV
jgi:hypothetical protein